MGEVVVVACDPAVLAVIVSPAKRFPAGHESRGGGADLRRRRRLLLLCDAISYSATKYYK